MTVILALHDTKHDSAPRLAFETISFPAGERHIKLKPTDDQIVNVGKVIISCRLDSSDAIMDLLLATDAVRRTFENPIISVIIPYLPYARQDRVMVPGEPLSIKVFADLINSQGYSKVFCYDPHSDVAPALINNLEAWPITEFIRRVPGWDSAVWVSPDAGQLKKIYKLAEKIGFKGQIVTASKVRNVETGEIVKIQLDSYDILCKRCLLIDDVCSRGGTFKALAACLKGAGAGRIELFTTHNERVFNQDSMKAAGIDVIYSTDSIQRQHNYSDSYFIEVS